MSGLANYLSVLDGPTQDGGLVLTVKSRNKAVPVNFDVTVAGLVKGTDIIDIATQISDALTAAYSTNNCLYNGTPSFSQDQSTDNRPPFALRNYQCDHIINVFNQVPYTIQEKSNTCGAIISFNSTPIYPTIRDARRFETTIGADFSGYTDADLVDALSLCSQEIVGYLGDGGVATCYLHKEVGFGYDGCLLEHFPIIENDHPTVRAAGIIGLVGTGGFSVEEGYELDEDGVLSFRDWGVVPYMNKPMDYNNLLAITYIAGFQNVPVALKLETIRLSTFIGVPLHVMKLRAGTFGMDFNKRRQDTIDLVKSNVERIAR